MKRSWKIRRQLAQFADGQQRWDRAFQHVLRWAQPPETQRMSRSDIDLEAGQEVGHESRDLRPCFDLAAGSDTVH
jgi:hypothetical protein